MLFAQMEFTSLCSFFLLANITFFLSRNEGCGSSQVSPNLRGRHEETRQTGKRIFAAGSSALQNMLDRLSFKTIFSSFN